MKNNKQLIRKLRNIGIVFLLALLGSNSVIAMEYRDNKIKIINGTSTYIFHTLTYEITDFSVTSGQDPDNKIRIGLINDFTLSRWYGSTTFQVGRKKSSDVADWFMDKIPEYRNIYNNYPGELNFAFIGKLTLVVSSGKGKLINEGTLTFENVAIAQGSNFYSNNWWFGGEHCAYTNGHEVICRGLSEKGDTVVAVFKASGDPYTIYINDIYYL